MLRKLPITMPWAEAKLLIRKVIFSTAVTNATCFVLEGPNKITIKEKLLHSK